MSRILYKLNDTTALAEVGIGGGVTSDAQILWHEGRDGDFPQVDISMEPARREVLVAQQDRNGKKMYRYVAGGVNKSSRQKILIQDKYLELYYIQTGEVIARKHLGEV